MSEPDPSDREDTTPVAGDSVAPDTPETDSPETDSPETDTPETDTPETDSPETASRDSESVDHGEVLFAEPGGSWWVVSIGPILVVAVLILEIAGPGSVHWPVLMIFLVLLFGFSVVQVTAARRHVSVELTETTLRQGAQRINLDQIEKIYPPNHDAAPEDWESARALGELHGVPRRRRGIGVRLTTGTIAQAWARDVERFRTELTEAHTAVRLGLPPRSRSDD